jgi:hypothetical protein
MWPATLEPTIGGCRVLAATRYSRRRRAGWPSSERLRRSLLNAPGRQDHPPPTATLAEVQLENRQLYPTFLLPEALRLLDRRACLEACGGGQAKIDAWEAVGVRVGRTPTQVAEIAMEILGRG